MRYNIHIHLFTKDAIPSRFVGILTPILASKVTYNVVMFVANYLAPVHYRSRLKRYALFARTYSNKTQADILSELTSEYPVEYDWAHVVLPMNMAHMGAGKVKQSYAVQIQELADIASNDNRVIPFYMVDPREPNSVGDFIDAIKNKKFRGLKIYPPLGYYPHDEVLHRIYSFMNHTGGLSVMMHGTRDSSVHFRGSDSELKKLLDVPYLPYKSRMDNTAIFNHPSHYKALLTRYRNVNWCFAHLGGDADIISNTGYFVLIKRLLVAHKNAFADISYVMFNKETWPIIKGLLESNQYRDKILFGSDYPLDMTEGDESDTVTEFIRYIGQPLFDKISIDNNKVYLNI